MMRTPKHVSTEDRIVSSRVQIVSRPMTVRSRIVHLDKLFDKMHYILSNDYLKGASQ
jgi:hypothetical protein